MARIKWKNRPGKGLAGRYCAGWYKGMYFSAEVRVSFQGWSLERPSEVLVRVEDGEEVVLRTRRGGKRGALKLLRRHLALVAEERERE